MTSPLQPQTIVADPELLEVVETACARIAPAWPLDRLIAVNPYWGWVDRPITTAAAALGAITGSPMVMPRSWFRTQWERGQLGVTDVQRAVVRVGTPVTLLDVWDGLRQDATPLPKHPLVTDPRTLSHGHPLQHTWEALVLDQISRACEAYFDAGQSTWGIDRTDGLYAHWRRVARTDAAPLLLLGARGIAAQVDDLPDAPLAVIEAALETLGLTRESRAPYLTALLMSVGGWAAACAHRRWEARLAGRDDTALHELLAVRIAWELMLYRAASGSDLAVQWTRERRAWQPHAERVAEQQRVDWLLQCSVEFRYHDALAQQLTAGDGITPLHGSTAPAPTPAPRVQAVFCIDVRSEVMRRALEHAGDDVATLGFAGFFGLPLAYAPLTGAPRPQLPGLLAAGVIAEDLLDARDERRADLIAARESTSTWSRTAASAPGAFGYVEATGIGALLQLMKSSFGAGEPVGDALRGGLDRTGAAAYPRLTTTTDGTPLTADSRAAMAAGALRGMGLTQGFAPLVAFIGHGVHLPNNPQAAGLACGACGGQSGEVNARALAELLNDPAVRVELADHGIEIPRGTAFVGGLHDTCTDDVTLYPAQHVTRTHATALAALQADLEQAGRRARRERAPRLGITVTDDQQLAAAMRARRADWSEVRPEWGLARNAAFIAAPRRRTRALDLDGRSFLHEYDWRRDAGFSVLETIMTAPMVVAHWINFQYYASTVDPRRFGSGDKTLHNVVGGTVGVYEGASGDLRIGLAEQSVHDGHDWFHEPLRLGVYLEAPAAAIDAIIARHETVRQLVEGEWLYLFRIDPDGAGVFQRDAAGWSKVPAPAE
jgi:uncharacterized protein YbcC (UPF0753/DUF2309 family)